MDKSDAKPLTSTKGLKIGDILGDNVVLYSNNPIDKYQYSIEKFYENSDDRICVSSRGVRVDNCNIRSFFLLKLSEPKIRGHRMTRIFA